MSVLSTPRRQRAALAAVVLASAGLLAACGDTDGTGAGEPTASAQGSSVAAVTASPATASAGAGGEQTTPSGYITHEAYAANPQMYAAGRVVLFFHADWCPDCQETEKNLEADPSSIPADLTVVEVDYDTQSDLREKYGVTQQWTFVSVDDDGKKLKQFTGTYTGADIAAEAV
jgi:thiol-disulfide isomerase/thioredoxin